MKSILLSVISFLLVMNVCAKNDVDMRTYLKKVLGNRSEEHTSELQSR